MAVAEQLLAHGADVELPDNYGQSPLFMACWKGLCIYFLYVACQFKLSFLQHQRFFITMSSQN